MRRIHVFLLALAGMWLWTRELSASRGAAIFAAIAFAFSMTFSQWILFPHTAVSPPNSQMSRPVSRGYDVAGRRGEFSQALLPAW